MASNIAKLPELLQCLSRTPPAIARTEGQVSRHPADLHNAHDPPRHGDGIDADGPSRCVDLWRLRSHGHMRPAIHDMRTRKARRRGRRRFADASAGSKRGDNGSVIPRPKGEPHK